MTSREIDALADKVRAIGDVIGRKVGIADIPVLREAMDELRKWAAVKRLMEP